METPDSKPKIIHIATMAATTAGVNNYFPVLYALRDDGTLWRKTDEAPWEQVEEIPE